VEVYHLRGRESLFLALVESLWTREALLTAPVGWEERAYTNDEPLRGRAREFHMQKGSSKPNYHVIVLFGLVLPLRPASLPEPERIEVAVAPAFGPYRRFFPREAVRHPAKANLHLIRRLVELVSSPGDLILYPFARTSSICAS
jgi:DNA modification methylase